MNKPRSKIHQGLALSGFLLVTFSAPLAGAFTPPGEWYLALNKPPWNPPAWIFGPAWTLLYMLMAVAAWLVWKHNGWGRPLMLYFLQLLLNAAWTPVFFGAHELGWALVVIVLLWFAILTTLLSFFRISRLAAFLIWPYLAWVTFATLLNFTLWQMNTA